MNVKELIKTNKGELSGQILDMNLIKFPVRSKSQIRGAEKKRNKLLQQNYLFIKDEVDIDEISKSKSHINNYVNFYEPSIAASISATRNKVSKLTLDPETRSLINRPEPGLKTP